MTETDRQRPISEIYIHTIVLYSTVQSITLNILEKSVCSFPRSDVISHV